MEDEACFSVEHGHFSVGLAVVPIGQHLVNLIVDKQFDTRLWCLIVNSAAIRP